MTEKPRIVTRNDIARLAGTSTAVVSYVLNNGPRPVSAAARERVEAAVRATGYRPNRIARALRARRSNVLGIIVPDSSNPFFAELARVVEDEAYRRGYFILLGSSAEDDAREAGYIHAFLEQQVEGLIVASAGHTGRGASNGAALAAAEVPVVLVDRGSGVKGASTLLVNNREGAAVAATHLIEVHGMGAVGCLAGPREIRVAQQRLRGWREALKAAGIEPRREWVRHSPFDRQHAFPVAYEWLQSVDRPPSMLTCSDEQALGVLRAARMLKIRVPDELAVVSFDGTPEADYTSPGLTTVAQPIEQIGQRAVDILLNPSSRPRTERFTAEIVVRESCGCNASP